MALGLQTLSAETVYATKPNIALPNAAAGQIQTATQVAAAAQQRLADMASTAGGLGVGGNASVTEGIVAAAVRVANP